MGLGGAPSVRDDYEWVRLADLPEESVDPLVDGMRRWLADHPLWRPGDGDRILLADLDNLRSRPVVWRARMAVVAELARQADHVVIAGQDEAVERAAPYLEEFAARALAVGHGDDLADYVLLAGADAVEADDVQVIVVSNDGIFASLAERGPLTVLSPGADAMSDRLRTVATAVIDLARVEERVAR